MTIIRAPRPASHYYLLRNSIAQDERLSWAARGLLIFLLTKPDAWRISIEHLRKQTGGARIRTGRDGIYSLLAELQAMGYVTAMRNRDQAGKLGEVDYIVSETPHPAQPEMDAPRPAQPDTAQPDTAGTTLVRTEEAITTHKTTTQQQHVQPPAAPSRFAEFWAAYPNKKGKQEAEKAWRKQKLDDRCDELIAHVCMMATQDDGWQRGFIPMASTYLNQARWEDQPATVDRAPRLSVVDQVMDNINRGGRRLSISAQIEQHIRAAQQFDDESFPALEGECWHPVQGGVP